jgi:imidazolonepropionase-like amidohydrolase
MRSKITRILLVIGLILSLLGSGCGSSSDVLVVKNGTLITGDGSQPIPDGLVAIEGGRIIFAGPEADYSIPRGAEVLDAAGGTILPGFIDSHTHSTSNTALRREFLTNGVTAVCDLGSPLDQLAEFSITAYQDQPAARGIAAGPILTAPGGLPGAVLDPGLNYEVANPEEGRAAVEDLYQGGASQIKVYLQGESNGILYPMLDQETLEAIVEAAHGKGMLVRAHVTYIPLLGMAVSAGVDTVEHIPINTPSAEMDEAALERRDLLLQSPDPLEVFFTAAFPEYQTWLEIMAERGVILVPTLERPYGQIFRAGSQDPLLAGAMKIILGIVGRYHEMGGPVGLGTDFNINIGMAKGIPLAELEMLSAAGLDPLAVIEASTKNAAAACGLGDELGTLEAGKIADLIVIPGDPLADLAVLGEVQLVILDGVVAFDSKKGD